MAQAFEILRSNSGARGPQCEFKRFFSTLSMNGAIIQPRPCGNVSRERDGLHVKRTQPRPRFEKNRQ